MTRLTPTRHGYLDYVTVVVFATAPLVLGLHGLAAWLAYALAGVHLLLTMLTRFAGGLVPLVPFRVHGAVEMLVGPALVVLPWVAGGAVADARWFYTAVGVVIVGVWLATDYAPGPPGPAPRAPGAPGQGPRPG